MRSSKTERTDGTPKETARSEAQLELALHHDAPTGNGTPKPPEKDKHFRSPATEPYQTFREAADRLGVGIHAIRRAASHRDFPTYTIGNSRKRVLLSEVIAAVRRLSARADNER